jgi:hypothetical protein
MGLWGELSMMLDLLFITIVMSCVGILLVILAAVIGER